MLGLLRSKYQTIVLGSIFIVLLVLIGMLLASARGSDARIIGDEGVVRVEPVQRALAPDFTLQSVDGTSFTLSSLRGQPVLINFWATWCGPCRIEMPAIQSSFERFRDKELVILAVNFDEPADVVRAYGDDLGLTFPLLLDPGAEIQHLYLNRSYPTSFFVDSDGIIQVQQIGVMTDGQLDQNLKRIGVSS